MQERVRAEWREQYDPNNELSLDELRQKVRDEFTSQARSQLAKEIGEEEVNVMDVQNVMEQMQQRNREMFKVRQLTSRSADTSRARPIPATPSLLLAFFAHPEVPVDRIRAPQVPPYILYVARAFSTLEGIGLSANEDYSIVSEAYPYLSKRLLTDDSPRAKAALRSMVYGSSEKDAANASPDFSKFLSMGEGMASYSTATSAVPTAAGASAAATAATGAAAAATGAAAAADSGAAGAAPGGGAADAAQDELVDLLGQRLDSSSATPLHLVTTVTLLYFGRGFHRCSGTE